jgi:D-alanyl-D-alanine carboxypeptidase
MPLASSNALRHAGRAGLALWLCALAPSAFAQASAQGQFSPELSQRIDADVHKVLARTQVPGAAVEVVEHGRVVYQKAYGLRDLARRLPARVDTHYEIGSITKQFTAAAIVQLQEAGKLDIDAKLSTYLPDAPHAGEVTLRQLLTHTSGLPEYLDGPNIEQEAGQAASFDQLMARIAGKPLDFAPGSRWAYDNTGYILLGRVIEVVSHESYDHYLHAHLLGPAGMTHTFTVADEARLPDMAVGYRRVDGKVEPAPTISASFGWSAGYLVSTLDDLERWNQALTSGRIVSPKGYALMTTTTVTPRGDEEYGFGLFVDSFEGQPRIGHTGGSFGFTTANEYFPRQDVRIIAFTNEADTPEPGEVLTTAVFDDLFPDIAAAATRPAPGEDTAVTARARAVFAQIQGGPEDASNFTAKLNAKLTAGLQQRLAKAWSVYGQPERFVFRGRRTASDVTWYDYLIDFGPGDLLKFGIGLDASGKVASLSFG